MTKSNWESGHRNGDAKSIAGHFPGRGDTMVTKVAFPRRGLSTTFPCWTRFIHLTPHGSVPEISPDVGNSAGENNKNKAKPKQKQLGGALN